MPRNQVDMTKAQETAVLLTIANCILIPAWKIDARLGLTAAVAGTGLLLYKLHEMGKARRPGGNAINTVNNLFAPYTGDPDTSMINMLRNIVNGGDAVVGSIIDICTKGMK